MAKTVDVSGGIGLDRKVRKSYWPARLDFLLSASGLFLAGSCGDTLAFVSTIFISKDAN